MGALCDFIGSHYLLFGSQVPPVVYYSHFSGIIVAVFAGIFILLTDKKSLINRTLAFIMLSFASWVFLDSVFWASNRSDVIMFVWATILLVEILVYAGSVYLVHIFLEKKDMTFTRKLVLAIPLLPVILLLPTKYSLVGFDLNTCLSIEGPIALYYTYFFEAFCALWILIFGIKKYLNATNKEQKREILYFIVGIVFFLVAFSYGNIVGSLTEDWAIAQYGLFGMPIFVGFLAYMIVKFKAFNAKVIATEALVWGLWILIGSELFFVTAAVNYILVSITLLIAISFGIFLIRSVRREVEQRERLEVLTKELDEKNIKLQQLDQQKNEFLSFASHDLKSPIALMKQWATLIADGTYKEPAKVNETALKIKGAADRAVNMVNTFLDLRKIEEGHMEYNFEEKNIVDFVKGITQDFATLAKQQKNIAITFSSKVAEIKVKIDTTTFRQVIQNYLDNALKYTDAGTIKVNVTEEQKNVLITVQDSGGGMDKEMLPILFGQFRRDPGVAKKIQGTGLGLFIAKQIVVAHHGDTWAESEGKGKGSTFFIRLPKA